MRNQFLTHKSILFDILNEITPNVSQFDRTDSKDIGNPIKMIMATSYHDQFDRKNRGEVREKDNLQIIGKMCDNSLTLTQTNTVECQDDLIIDFVIFDKEELETIPNDSNDKVTQRKSDRANNENNITLANKPVHGIVIDAGERPNDENKQGICYLSMWNLN